MSEIPFIDLGKALCVAFGIDPAHLTRLTIDLKVGEVPRIKTEQIMTERTPDEAITFVGKVVKRYHLVDEDDT